MLRILTLLLTIFALSGIAKADIKECGSYPSVYKYQSCARYSNITPYRVCLYSIEKLSVKVTQVVTGDMVCIDPGTEKVLISKYTTTSGVLTSGGSPVDVEIYYHPREERNQYSWFPVSGLTSCINVSFSSSGYLQEFNGFDYDPREKCSYTPVYALTGDYTFSVQNAAKISNGGSGAGTGGTQPSGNKSDSEKEIEQLKKDIEQVKADSRVLQEKIAKCSFDTLKSVLDRDLGVIDYNAVMTTVIACDEQLRKKVQSAKEKKEELDSIVKQVQRSLKEDFLPKQRDRFVSLGASFPFDNDYTSLGLNALYMKNAYIFGVDKNTFFVELAGRYIDDFFNPSIAQKNEFNYRGAANSWGESFTFYPDELLPANVTTDKKIDYLASVYKVKDALKVADQTFAKKLNEYGYAEDSPVPVEVQELVVKEIVSRHPDEGEKVQRALQSWKSPLSNHQENLLISIEGLADLYRASKENPYEDGLTLRKIARGLGDAAIDFAQCAARGGLTDAADWYEITTGYEWCGEGQLTNTGRVVSAAGLAFGSSKVWRKMAELAGLSVRIVKKGANKVFELTAVAIDSAKKIGITTTTEFKVFGDTLKKYKLDIPQFPVGIGYRSDLKQHLSAFDGFTQKAGIKGAHNSEAFAKAITDNGARIANTTEYASIPGIKVVEYEIPKLDSALKPTGEFKAGFKKTVYDPNIISDAEILQLGQIAAANGYEKAISEGSRSFIEKVGGIDFQVFLDGSAVSNVFPIIEGVL